MCFINNRFPCLVVHLPGRFKPPALLVFLDCVSRLVAIDTIHRNIESKFAQTLLEVAHIGTCHIGTLDLQVAER